MSIVSDLVREIARVNALLERLAGAELDNAQRAVRFAHLAMVQAALEDMYASLDDLRAITVASGSGSQIPKSKEPE